MSMRQTSRHAELRAFLDPVLLFLNVEEPGTVLAARLRIDPAPVDTGSLGDAMFSLFGQLEAADDTEVAFDAGLFRDTLIDAIPLVLGLATAAAPPDGTLFLRRLYDLCLAQYLTSRVASLAGLLRVAGVIPAEGEAPDLDWGVLRRLVSDPAAWATEAHGWGGADPVILHDTLFHALRDLTVSFGGSLPHRLDLDPAEASALNVDSDAVKAYLPMIQDELDAGLVDPASSFLFPFRHEAGLVLLPYRDSAGRSGAGIGAYARGALDRVFDLEDGWAIAVSASGAADLGKVIAIAPGGHQTFDVTGATLTLSAELRLTPDEPFAIVPETPLLAVSAAAFRLGVFHDGDALSLEAALDEVEVRMPAGEDGFLARLLPERATLSIGTLGVRATRDGASLVGGAGLTWRASLGLTAGPARVTMATFVLDPETLSFTVTADVDAKIGPVSAAVEGLGVRLEPRMPEGDEANAELFVGLVPPRGLGLSVDAGPVSGGGFIAHDPDRGRYVGALSLDVGELGIGAFGILDTRLPGQEDGWSLLLFMYASFPAIQLGFGFTLDGVGGIVGVHRGVDVDALFASVRAGTAGRLLAPDDPVRDAPVLAEEAGTLFPVQRNQHTLGPSLRLGWGTPSLVQLDVALAVSLPDPLRIVLIGSLHAALPKENVAIVLLNVDVAGVLDFGASRLDAEGRLYDSHVQLIPIQGGFALRSSWGRSKSLAFSVGGLHPRYTPPPGFPELDRLGTDLSRGSLRVRLWGYFAVTSNSLQLGAGADLRFAAKGFLVEGGLAFDALILLTPFQLDVSIRAWVSISHRGDYLLSLRLEGRLTGPNRWVVKGSVHVKVLLFDVSVGVEASFGSRREVGLDPERVLPYLERALSDPSSWESAGPSTSSVVLDEMAGLLAPDAPAAVSQRTAPLEIRLDRFRAAEVAGPRRFRITGAEVNGRSRALADERTEEFAPGDFRDMTEAERLAAPSFEPLPSGVSLAVGESAEEGPALTAATGPEVIVIDEPDDAPRRSRPVVWAHTVPALRRAGPAAAPAPMLTVEAERWTTTAAPGAGSSWALASEGAGVPALEVELT